MTDMHKPTGTAAPEFLAWANEHQRQRRRHDAVLAQITEHPDPHSDKETMAQQQAWARLRQHDRRLKDSSMAQIRHHSHGDQTQ